MAREMTRTTVSGGFDAVGTVDAPPAETAAGGTGAAGGDLPALVEVRVVRGEPRRAVELDGLRAVAVLGIVAYHVIVLLPATWHIAYPLVLRFDVALELFFMISGYLIYGPFARSHIQGRSAPRLRDYLVRRAVRIYPAYLVAVLGMVALGWAHFDDGAQMVQHLTLTQGYFPRGEGLLVEPAGLGQSWTLVVEVSFYLFVPLWSWAVRGLARGHDALGAEVAGIAVLVTVGTVAAGQASYGPLPSPFCVLPPHLVSLGWGMLLAVVTARGAFRPSRPAWLGRPARVPTTELCWIAAAAALVLLASRIDMFPDEPPELLLGQAVNFLAAALMVTPVVLGAATMGLVPRLLGWRPVVTVGIVSYGIYLWHLDLLLELPGAWETEPVAPAPGGMAVNVAVAVALGLASFHLVEQPLMTRAGRALAARRRPATTTSTAAAAPATPAAPAVAATS